MNGQRQINIPPSLAGIIRTRITLAGLHVVFKILKVYVVAGLACFSLYQTTQRQRFFGRDILYCLLVWYKMSSMRS